MKSSTMRCLLGIILGAALIISFGSPTVVAADFPTIQELTNGKVKPGDVITKDNVDLVKDLIPDGYYDMTKRGMEIIIREPGQWMTPGYFVEITKKNDGQAYIDEEDNLRSKGGLYSGDPGGWWDGGIPFPDPQMGDPKAGIQCYYNDLHAYEGDDFTHDQTMPMYVGSDGNLERTINMSWDRLYLTARELLDPKPTYAKKYKDVAFKEFAYVQWPFDLKGFGNLIIRYNDQTKQDDNYAFIPAMRRVRRLSTAQKFDAFVGCDCSAGDLRQLNVPAATWKFKLIDKKPRLCMMHSDSWSVTKGDPQVLPPFTVGQKFLRVPWEIVPEVYAIECAPKDPRDCPIYSKKVLYLGGYIGNTDPVDAYHRTWRTLYSVAYDVQGVLLKSVWNCYYGYGEPEKGRGIADVHYETCYGCYDHQIDHSSPWVVDLPSRKFNAGFTPERFSIGYLQKVGR